MSITTATGALSGKRAASFFFNDTATTEIYTLSLHDALPICLSVVAVFDDGAAFAERVARAAEGAAVANEVDRKSTRLNSSHANISYAVFCLKKNNPGSTLLPVPRPTAAAIGAPARHQGRPHD